MRAIVAHAAKDLRVEEAADPGSVPRTFVSASPSAAFAAPTYTITTTAASAPCGCASR